MKKYILFAILTVAVVACGGGSDGGDEAEISKDYLNVPPNLNLLGDGQSVELTIDANCSWTITKDVDWLSVSPMSGQNKQNVEVSAGKNTMPSARYAVLTIKGGSLTRRVTVTQAKPSDAPEEPIEYSMSVSKSTLSFESTGGTLTFTISSNTNWVITAPSWCSVIPMTGSGNATISVSVEEAANGQQRSGQITVSGTGVTPISVSVSQKAKGSDNGQTPGAGDNLPPS